MLTLYRCYHRGKPPLSWLVRYGTWPTGWPFSRVPGHVSNIVVNGSITKIESVWPCVRGSKLTLAQWEDLKANWQKHGLVCPPVEMRLDRNRPLPRPEQAANYLIGQIGKPYGLLAVTLDFLYWCTLCLWGRLFKREHIIVTISRHIAKGAGPDCAELTDYAKWHGGGRLIRTRDPVSPAQELEADVKAELISW